MEAEAPVSWQVSAPAPELLLVLVGGLVQASAPWELALVLVLASAKLLGVALAPDLALVLELALALMLALALASTLAPASALALAVVFALAQDSMVVELVWLRVPMSVLDARCVVVFALVVQVHALSWRHGLGEKRLWKVLS